jgi:hypothetical protein
MLVGEGVAALDCFAALAMTVCEVRKPSAASARHCEEQRDEVIQGAMLSPFAK